MLFDFFDENQINPNIKEIYFAEDLPHIIVKTIFAKLADKLKSKFNINEVGDWTVEIDPRRVDENKLLFYKNCGVNRISFGVQDFDLEVQKRINRIQPSTLLDNLLSEKSKKKVSSF